MRSDKRMRKSTRWRRDVSTVFHSFTVHTEYTVLKVEKGANGKKLIINQAPIKISSKVNHLTKFSFSETHKKNSGEGGENNIK